MIIINNTSNKKLLPISPSKQIMLSPGEKYECSLPSLRKMNLRIILNSFPCIISDAEKTYLNNINLRCVEYKEPKIEGINESLSPKQEEVIEEKDEEEVVIDLEITKEPEIIEI